MTDFASTTRDRGGSHHLCNPYDSDTRHEQLLVLKHAEHHAAKQQD